jgi:hypothetical protein
LNPLTVALIALWIATISQTIFIVVYGVFSPWWRGRFVGRALFVKSTALWLALMNSLVAFYWPYPHRREIVAVIMCAVAFGCTYQALAVIQRRYLDRADRRRT